MANEFFCEKNKLYLSYAYLKKCGVTEAAIKNWVQRKTCKGLLRDGLAYLNYDEIPAPTRKKLPRKIDLEAECHLQEDTAKVDKHYAPLYHAYTKGWIQILPQYKEKYPTVQLEKLQEAAKMHAMWHYIISENIKDHTCLFKAFDKVYPGRYASANVLSNKKGEAKKEGIEAVAFKKTIVTAKNNIKKVSTLNKFWVAEVIRLGTKFTPIQTWRKICDVCEKSGEDKPSHSWVNKFQTDILKGNYTVFEDRYGKAAAVKQMIIATMDNATYANDLWLLDGWTLPFWVDGFKRYVIVVVKDAHSKKIIGFAIGETENTVVIMEALRNAIINTGCLPYQIVTDNHAWNATSENKNFKEEISRIGTKYTVTHIPTHKAIIERGFGYLNALCKEHWGYIGEGIKSKNRDAHPKQELLDQYAKRPITATDVKGIGFEIVDCFNGNILKKEGKSPNQLYDESEKPNCFIVDVFQRVKILTSKTEIKVNRGQVTIKRGLGIYEYQLPAELFEKYNNRVVTVRYEDLSEGIYLYDKVTDTPITELSPKQKIHNALANMTEDDTDLMNKHTGRKKGIISHSKKSLEKLRDAALEDNPEAVELLNPVTLPKELAKECRERGSLKKYAEDNGIDLKKIPTNAERGIKTISAAPAKKKVNESPFQPSKDHKMIKIPRNKPLDYD